MYTKIIKLLRLLIKKYIPLVLLVTLFLTISLNIDAQAVNDSVIKDSSYINIKTKQLYARRKADTIAKKGSKDTLVNSKKNALDAKVDYSASDSIRFDIKNKKSYLYNSAVISYQTLNIKSDFIELDFNLNTLTATGVPDSAGKEKGLPVFKDGEQSFKAKKIKYNFKTKKGLSNEVITKEGDSYLHGSTVKKMSDDITYIFKGKYTTCDLDHPHYHIDFAKAKVIPKNKIVSGPAYLVIEDVPTPIAIPFGFFPNKNGRHSGILLPKYGESANRGFFFEDLGYYWGINDYIDMEFRGDIYTRGSWGIKNTTRYKKRYKFDGSLSVSYAFNKIGQENTPEFSSSKDFSIKWKHVQDPKSRPNSKFSADVNFQSGKYNQYNPVSTVDYLSNTFSSSISYSATLFQKVYLSANLTHSQNTNTHRIDMSLPDINISVNRFYPLRRKTHIGEIKWYENIGVDYRVTVQNKISTYDSLLFRAESIKQFQNGISHTLSISNPIKLFKFFTLTNSFSFNEKWYISSIRKSWRNDTLFAHNDTIVGYLKTDTVYGFKAAHDFSLGSSLNTKLYGIIQFKRGPLRAIRHVITPSVGFSYRPDFGKDFWGYYKTVQKDTLGRTERYSVFQNGIFGSPPTGKSGSLNFSISNNLEIKVRNRKDTVTGTKKIVLIENFTISSSYDFALDSLKWSYLSLRGNTRLFKYINITYASLWDPYIIDSLGRRRNQFEWKVNKRLFRLDNTSWNFGASLNLNPSFFKKGGNENPAPPTSYIQNPDEINFKIPWNLNINYNLVYTSQYMALTDKTVKKVIQTLSFNGDLSLTPKWKIGVSSGYDFEQKKISYTSVSLYRDLHCWEMKFEWVPIGFRKSWNFVIRVKASVLQDLKIEKKKDFRDINTR